MQNPILEPKEANRNSACEQNIDFTDKFGTPETFYMHFSAFFASTTPTRHRKGSQTNAEFIHFLHAFQHFWSDEAPTPAEVAPQTLSATLHGNAIPQKAVKKPLVLEIKCKHTKSHLEAQ